MYTAERNPYVWVNVLSDDDFLSSDDESQSPNKKNGVVGRVTDGEKVFFVVLNFYEAFGRSSKR